MSDPIEAILDGVGDDTWPALWKFLRCEIESAVTRFLVARPVFDVDEQTKGKMLAWMEDYVMGVVE